MYRFCVKADRCLGESLQERLDACGRLLVSEIELDAGFAGRSLADLTGREIERVRSMLIQTCKRIALLDCDAEGLDAERAGLLFRKAHLLGVEHVNFAPTPGGLPALEGALAAALPAARSFGIGVTVENRRSSCLAKEPDIAALLRRFGQYGPELAFNPLEFAAEKTHPFFHVFYNSRLKGAVRFLRVNDGLFAGGGSALPAEGNAEIKELASALLARGFRGCFSFHPYLPGMGIREYEEVIGRFKRLLTEM